MRRLLISLTAGLVSFLSISAQDFSLATNLADYAALGTLNIEASYATARHWTIIAGAKYNPFTFGHGNETMMNRQRSVSAGARWWPWHVFSGWWLSGKAQCQEYNIGGLVSSTTVEGYRLGGVLSGGYAYMLNKHLNASLGLGLWGGYDNYTEYSCPVCGITTDKGEKFFVLPDELILSLTYVF